MSLALGFDLGGTTVTAALVSEQGEILHSLDAPTPAAQPAQATLDLMEKLFADLLAHTQEEVVGIGMGIAGLINPYQGVVHTSPNLPLWQDVDLRSPLQKRFGLPVYLDNDE